MDRQLAAKFQAALTRAGVPTVDVSIGSETDRGTWRIGYALDASAAQREMGETLRLTYDPDTDPAWNDEQAMLRYNTETLVQAVSVALWECIPNPTMTKAQLKTRVITLYKAMM